MQPTTQTIAELYARLAALEATNTGGKAAGRPPGRKNIRRLACAMLAVLLLVTMIPVGVFAAGPFSDLDPASPHNTNITAIQAAGITKGCDAPDFSNYCPKASVTREEMASFLARTAGLGGNPPVTNAQTAVTAAKLATNPVGGAGYSANELLRIAGNPQPTSVMLNSNAPLLGAATTITAPTSGFVLITGTAFLFHDSLNCPCRIDMDIIDTATNGGIPGALAEQTIYNVPGGVAYGSLSYTQLFPVSAGTHSYAVRLTRVGGSTSLAGHSNITALFVPFGSTGNTP